MPGSTIAVGVTVSVGSGVCEAVAGGGLVGVKGVAVACVAAGFGVGGASAAKRGIPQKTNATSARARTPPYIQGRGTERRGGSEGAGGIVNPSTFVFIYGAIGVPRLTSGGSGSESVAINA